MVLVVGQAGKGTMLVEIEKNWQSQHVKGTGTDKGVKGHPPLTVSTSTTVTHAPAYSCHGRGRCSVSQVKVLEKVQPPQQNAWPLPMPLSKFFCSPPKPQRKRWGGVKERTRCE